MMLSPQAAPGSQYTNHSAPNQYTGLNHVGPTPGTNYMASHPQPSGIPQAHGYSQMATNQLPQAYYPPTNLGATPAAPPATAPAALGPGPKKAGAGPARKVKRTPEDIAWDEDAAALSRAIRVKKAATKATTAQDKIVSKRAKALHRQDEASNVVPCLVWGDANSLELLAFWKSAKDSHTEHKERDAGFINFCKFIKDYKLDGERFPLIAHLSRDQLKS
ncbi:hypothetical protein PTTG_00797 [Puccinia triticina 1-1 BBBD Race 1]|uniref:Uncharacterized protein n=1 Tax=Puccinia triticina (isolate 1-1 / race 1 (BBBD)) TaxID=630390 RepID=A0A0C4EJ80_PUCT1|nr:hypothetical protein PTTG_00797 [Puccinia triticina 1-1 BBBD Race 1]